MSGTADGRPVRPRLGALSWRRLLIASAAAAAPLGLGVPLDLLIEDELDAEYRDLCEAERDEP